MDISILGNLGLGAVFFPLFFAIYLIVARFRLSYVPKWFLNNGVAIINIIVLAIFCSVFYFGNESEVGFKIFELEKFSVSLGLLINGQNVPFLIFSALVSFLIAVYSKAYFNKKKQFMFTKQRYYTFLLLLSFLTYLLLVSPNLFQSIFILMAQTILVLIFAYFDIFKNPVNFNITRFNRISQIGNFAFLLGILILFRYSILSQGYITSNSLDYNELNALVSYTYGISSTIEFKLIYICFIIGIMTRLMVFPFSCYYSFLANSSNLFYLSIFALMNNIIGIFLLIKFLPILQMFPNALFYFEGLLVFGVIFALIQLLFEKNIKIIFGYLLSILNSISIIMFLISQFEILKYIYFGLNLILIFVLMIFLAKDKNNFKKRMIKKELGFILEKSHIFFFEVLISKISGFLEFLYEKIIENLILPFAKIFNYLISIFALRTVKSNGIKNVQKILLIFALMAIFAIFIALFGGFKC